VEEVTQATARAVSDPMAVFAFVLNSLPDQVKVCPTENYSYLTFFRGGMPDDGKAICRLNTYFDGAFDQLPDNFIEGETVRKAILQVSPGIKGWMDRFGQFAGRRRPVS
jgi:hypothetical protein